MGNRHGARPVGQTLRLRSLGIELSAEKSARAPPRPDLDGRSSALQTRPQTFEIATLRLPPNHASRHGRVLAPPSGAARAGPDKRGARPRGGPTPEPQRGSIMRASRSPRSSKRKMSRQVLAAESRDGRHQDPAIGTDHVLTRRHAPKIPTRVRKALMMAAPADRRGGSLIFFQKRTTPC